jgi:hypothetical protein
MWNGDSTCAIWWQTGFSMVAGEFPLPITIWSTAYFHAFKKINENKSSFVIEQEHWPWRLEVENKKIFLAKKFVPLDIRGIVHTFFVVSFFVLRARIRYGEGGKSLFPRGHDANIFHSSGLSFFQWIKDINLVYSDIFAKF